MPEQVKDYDMAIMLFVLLIMFIYAVRLCMCTRGKKQVIGCGPRCTGNCKMSEKANKLNDLNVLFVKMEGCIHCQRLKELLVKHNVSNLFTEIDSDSPELNRLIEKYGEIPGFPTLISVTTGKKHIGGCNNIDEIIKKLS